MKLLLSVFLTLCVFNAVAQDGREDTTKTKSDSSDYILLESQPAYPGGFGEMLKFINKNKKYPKEARSSGAEGQVKVMFIVEKDGSIREVKVITGLHPALDAEAVRVIKMMPKWSPGKQGGRAVKSQFLIPIKFSRN